MVSQENKKADPMDKTEELLKKLERANKLISDQKHALDQSAIVAITDKQGVISYVNQKFCDLSKYSEEELIGQTHGLLNSSFHDRSFFADMWKTIGNGNVWNGEICNKAKDGSFYWVDTTIVPFLDEQGKPYQYIAIRYDISHKKETEQELAVERERLFSSEKMASLGILSAGISHELGNPLGALRGRLEMLERLGEKSPAVSSERVISDVQIMIDLVDRMGKIIRGLRAYARDGSQDPYELVDIGNLIGDIVEISRERLRKNNLKMDISQQSKALVRGRESELGQVFVNIFNNAIDAARGGEEKWIKIDIEKKDGDLLVRFIDSGPGIDEKVAQKIFDPFYTTKPVGEGTGLGLSICRSIVEAHQGSIILKNVDKNTCFEIQLPLSKEL